MKGVRPIFLPPLPWVSYFSELNVRTYVKTQGKPGVYFFSLDAGNRIIVEIARKYFHLPYLNADIHFKREGIKKEFHCFRIDSRANPGEFHVLLRKFINRNKILWKIGSQKDIVFIV
ncbi:hypothetical protein LA733_3005 [Leptospira interrogans]|nr:hypothetical protein LEP1GSC158_4336 [Leptospira interrogans serovar Zanoni str. LT2156]KWV22818.1 hypothetical protein LA733_3005 [Leptospira interrogans]KWV24378.1 hypothetical protein LA702_2901 [Leptospira interrogans]